MSEKNQEPLEVTREHRLHALCPYYAMFPARFARECILAYTEPGEIVFDPFSGRGTTVLEALLRDRMGIGTDINPVAAIVSKAKSHVPQPGRIESRLSHLEMCFKSTDKRPLRNEANKLPKFFKHAYAPLTLQQILFLRRTLDWQQGVVDRFVSALVLGHLHGESKSPSYLSNQMPHTIAPKQKYAIQYWKAHNLKAPKRDAFELLRRKAIFRLQDGRPEGSGKVALTDARKASSRLKEYKGKVAATITSPPYLDVTSFEEDQWLRLWFLGGLPNPTYGRVSHDDRHRQQSTYFKFLSEVWTGIKPLMKPTSVLVCRIGTMHIPFKVLNTQLTQTIKGVWPKAEHIHSPFASTLQNRQTDIFLPGTVGCENEYDFVFRLAS